ncbi:MAG: PEGA domain-containing protein [Candidatus Micrarchaeota archaeon]
MDKKGPIIFGLVLICIFVILFLTSTGKDTGGQAYKAVEDAKDSDAAPRDYNGMISVYSNPLVANIYLNDVYKGTTPKTFAAKAGKYTLKLSKAGFLPYTAQITVPEVETLYVNANLTLNVTASPSPSAAINNTNGTLTVMTKPVDATLDVYPPGVLVNPLYRGLTPVSLSLQANSYIVVITKAGYENYYTTADVVRGRVTTVSVTLVKSG